MKKYFWCEFKRNKNALIVLTALCAVLACVIAFNLDLLRERPLYVNGVIVNGQYAVSPRGDGGIAFYCGMLIVLCGFVPAYIYSFKMKKRSVDAHYSLPMRREGLYFVKTLIGLILTFVPYTVAFFMGTAVVAMRENLYEMQYLFLYYLFSLPLGVLLYGFYAFIFTRANTVGDGVVFMLAWTFVVELVLCVILELFRYWGFQAALPFLNDGDAFGMCHLSIGLFVQIADVCGDLLRSATTGSVSLHTVAFAILSGAGAWALLFLSLKKEKAENAEQISSSWWGYRILIPVYLAGVVGGSNTLLGWCLTWIAAFVGFVVYRRSVKLKASDWLSLLAALVVGVLISSILW